MSELIQNFNRELDEALLSLDEEKIRAHYDKWKTEEVRPLSKDPEVFWGAVHKAITGRASLPIEFRKKSKAYLDARGLRSYDDGDL